MIWQNYGHEFVVSLFWPTLYMNYACLLAQLNTHRKPITITQLPKTDFTNSKLFVSKFVKNNEIPHDHSLFNKSTIKQHDEKLSRIITLVQRMYTQYNFSQFDTQPNVLLPR